MKWRVIVMKNGCTSGVKVWFLMIVVCFCHWFWFFCFSVQVVELEDSFSLLLSAASTVLAVDGARIFNYVGAEVRDIGLIRFADSFYLVRWISDFLICSLWFRDGDTLHISEGEDFSSNDRPHSDWVTLNVGGRLFATTRMNLSMLNETPPINHQSPPINHQHQSNPHISFRRGGNSQRTSKHVGTNVLQLHDQLQGQRRSLPGRPQPQVIWTDTELPPTQQTGTGTEPQRSPRGSAVLRHWIHYALSRMTDR